MPRFLSAVTTRSSFVLKLFIQTCRTLFESGASQASREPSGDSAGEVRSGLPKSSSRGIKGGASERSGLLVVSSAFFVIVLWFQYKSLKGTMRKTGNKEGSQHPPSQDCGRRAG